MNNLERAQRDWETPPDEEEAKFCEECNEELEWKPDYVGKTPMTSGYWECTNQFCPEKFENHPQVIIDMANELVETSESLKERQSTLGYVRHKLSVVQDKLKEREKTIETLEKVIENLTQSQSKEVVRDTDYAIRRMEDAIEFLEIGDKYDMTPVRREWNEVKKILLQF